MLFRLCEKARRGMLVYVIRKTAYGFAGTTRDRRASLIIL